jgi:ribose transport system permease protein
VCEGRRQPALVAVLPGVDPFREMVLEGVLITLVVYLDNLQKRQQSGG